ncbi:MAG TPA: hypothetical protein DEV81_15365 [Cyanobacteria bacterium UBA11049]|nr:hypothetical protein [Cyanobacteria bacterium UBA11049]
MTRKQPAFLPRSRTLVILLVLFLCTAVLPPTLAYTTAENAIIQNLPNAQLVQQGKNLYEAERFSEAVKILQQAVNSFKASGDKLSQAMVLSNLSLAYQQLGQWDKAENAIANSLSLLEYPVKKRAGGAGGKIQNLEVIAQILDVKGRLQLARGQTEQALTTWQQAADIYVKLKDNAGLIRNQINSAQALQSLGHYLQAEKTLTQVQQSLQKQPNSALKATGLRSLGNVYRVVGNLKVSRQVLEESLNVATRWPRSRPPSASQSSQAIADTLLSLGNTARAQQDTQAALKFYQQAEDASAPTTRLQAQLNQLSLLVETKQWDSAKVLYPQIQAGLANLPPTRTAVYAQINFAQSLMKLGARERDVAQILSTAVQQAKSLGDKRAEAYALGSLGSLYEQTQQWNEAENLTQQALFITQTIDATDIAYRWQWQLGRIFRDRGNIPEAIAAYTQAVKNLEFLRKDLVAINPQVQFNFRDEVEPVYRQLVDLLLQSPPGSQAEPGNESRNLVQARNTIESLQLAELENFFRSACLDPKPELIDRVVDSGDRTAAVIYSIILPERLEIVLKLPNQILRHYATKISNTEVETTLEQLQQYLKEPDRTNDVQKLSARVYSWLIQPLEAELEKTQLKKLVFVLDSALRNIPMAVLYDNKQQKYLLEKYAIALTPSLQLLEPQFLQREKLNVLVAGLDQKREVEGQEFPQLENARLELKQIQSEVPKSKELFNQNFTATNVQNQLNSTPFSVVHMATHGQFSSNLDETFILTWDRLLKIVDLDNLIRNSNWDNYRAIELLVLSACETAAGDNRAALGLAGIAVRAGSRSTLATLWSVDDRSAAALMNEFYKQLTDRNLTKAEALQRAQLSLWNNPSQDWKRPYFWAAYTLVGNWL